jgi:hypothetical protein
VANVAGRSPFPRRAMAAIRPTSGAVAGADASGVLSYGGGRQWVMWAAEAVSCAGGGNGPGPALSLGTGGCEQAY